MSADRRIAFRYLVIGGWSLLTVSMILWWLWLGLEQASLISALQSEEGQRLAHYQRMLIWEGVVLIGLVLCGGGSLAYFVFRETKLSRRIQLFFLTFAHELKTPLASLRLQAESLHEDLHDTPQRELVDRLVSDTARLSMQLENSLLFSNLESAKLYLEDISLGELIESIRQEWPSLQYRQNCECVLRVDRRIMESILKNLFHNSLKHGEASEISVVVEKLDDQMVEIEINDNGRGYQHSIKNLGRPLVRHYEGSGSGLGLYLVKSLLRRMGGRFCVNPRESGFSVSVSVRGRLQ
ncbi:MAG: HAMP domain-containing histidine kinase [Bdellovibrionales bacterium]|nr:HAMP domain-containing histidine kinase [Bdellovibrionales bacterium]